MLAITATSCVKVIKLDDDYVAAAVVYIKSAGWFEFSVLVSYRL